MPLIITRGELITFKAREDHTDVLPTTFKTFTVHKETLLGVAPDFFNKVESEGESTDGSIIVGEENSHEFQALLHWIAHRSILERPHIHSLEDYEDFLITMYSKARPEYYNLPEFQIAIVDELHRKHTAKETTLSNIILAYELTDEDCGLRRLYVDAQLLLSDRKFNRNQQEWLDVAGGEEIRDDLFNAARKAYTTPLKAKEAYHS